MADNLGIKIQLMFGESLATENNKLKNILKELQNYLNSNPLKFKFDMGNTKDIIDAIKQIQNEMKKVQETTQSTPIVKIPVDEIKKGEAEYERFKNLLNQITSEITKNNNNINNIQITADKDGKMTGAVIRYTNSVGKAITDTYRLKTAMKEVTNEQTGKVENVRTPILELSSSQYNSNIGKLQEEAYRKASAEVQKIVNLTSQKKNIDSRNAEDLDKINADLIKAREVYGQIAKSTVDIGNGQKVNLITTEQMTKLAQQLNQTQKEGVANWKLQGAVKVQNVTPQQFNYGAGIKELRDYALATNTMTTASERATLRINQMSESEDNLGNKIRRVNYSFRDSESNIRHYQMVLDQTGQSVYNIDRGISDTFTSLTQRIGQFAQNYIAFNIINSAVSAFRDAISGTVQYIADMDNKMTDLAKVVDFNASQLDYMRQSAIELGKALGQSTTNIMAGMAETGRTFKNEQDIIEFTKTAAMASNVTTLSAQEASKALQTAGIAFGKGGDLSYAKKTLDEWNELQNKNRKTLEMRL